MAISTRVTADAITIINVTSLRVFVLYSMILWVLFIKTNEQTIISQN